MRIAEWGDRIRHSMWFIPALCTVGAGCAALLLVWISAATDLQPTNLPFVFSAGVDGARAMLQAIAASIITVAGVVFSVTIVALQLTSSQFSPRVLRNFLRDRSNQLVLGAFMGTFTYTLLVLRSIRAEDSNADSFVPAFAVTGALVLTLVSLGMLIYFIHHISVRIQVTSIVASVAQDTIDTIDSMASRWHPDESRSWHPATEAVFVPVPPGGTIMSAQAPASAELLPAPESGYLQLVDIGALVRAAQDASGRLRLLVRPGGWVQEGMACAAFEPSPGTTPDHERLVDALGDGLGVGHERSIADDAAFGIQQLVDVAIKALSPSVNDPTTTMNCIDRLVQVLVSAGAGRDTPRSFADADGIVRLEVPYAGFDELVDLAFDQIRHYASTTPAVVIHLAWALSVLRALPPERLAAVQRHARLLSRAAEAIPNEDERGRAREAIAPLLG